MDKCVFCNIASTLVDNENSNCLYQDDDCFVIKDKYPAARTHYLLIPKKHMPDLDYAINNDFVLVSRILSKIPKITKAIGMTDYKLITNNGAMAGQTIMHLHFHLMCD